MALANSRHIAIGDHSYEWAIRSAYGKDRYSLGWTPAALCLTIRDGQQTYQFLCTSKHWTAAHTEDWEDGNGGAAAQPHKVAFGPRQAREIIEQGLAPCTLTDWVVTIMKQRSV